MNNIICTNINLIIRLCFFIVQSISSWIPWSLGQWCWNGRTFPVYSQCYISCHRSGSEGKNTKMCSYGRKKWQFFFKKREKVSITFLLILVLVFLPPLPSPTGMGTSKVIVERRYGEPINFLFMPEMVLLGSLASNEKNTGCESWAKIEFYFHFFTLWHLF